MPGPGSKAGRPWTWDPRVVQERLGHSSIAITLGTYSHVAPVMHEEAAELVAGLFRRP